MTKSKLLFTISLSLIALVVSSRLPYRRCPKIYRSGAQFKCSTNFQNYCAFYRDDNSDLLQKLTANECTACTDQSVVGYSTQRCNAQKVYCDPRVRPDTCTEEYISICAYTSENCNDNSCRKVGGNPCLACMDPEVLFYEKGECPQPEEGICDNRPTECVTDEYDPVCGYYTEGCPFETCATTYVAPCWACLDPKVSSYEKGECDRSDEVLNCELLDYPAVCPTVNEPVCGSRRDCSGDDCVRTFSNGCFACSNGYTLFKNGECPQ